MTKLCRPILVPIESNNLLITDRKYLSLSNGRLYNPFKNCHYQLILISLDPEENIEECDLKYNPKLNTIWKHNRENKEIPDNIKHITSIDTVKVIATEEQLSQEYIKQFVEEYNKGVINDLEIEMEEDGYIINKSFPASVKQRLVIKLKNGFVTIVEKDSCNKCKNTCKKTSTITNEFGSCTEFNKESITYTEEECLKYCLKALEIGFDLNNTTLPILYEKSGKQYFIDWFEQNKKK